LWRKAAAGSLLPWETSDEGALALTIVLDQFPRNMFRGDAQAYASDALARQVAGRALARCLVDSLPPHGIPARSHATALFRAMGQMHIQQQHIGLLVECARTIDIASVSNR